MRRVVALGVALIALVSVGLIYSKIAQARRETAYRAAVEPYQRDLPVGMPRADVEKYLASRHVEYHAASYREGYTTYELKIGEDPGNLVCEAWQVYIALEFNSSDKLAEVHIRKTGTCL
jgi:hypothetical protein